MALNDSADIAFDPSTGEDDGSPISYRVPSYLLGADNHTIGKNGGASWFDPSTWGDVAGNIGKFAAVSMLSGANSFYNSGAAIGRLLGAESEQNDTGAWIASLDEDLGQYYSENKSSADIAGFLASSLVPGIAGIKLFNVGQKALQTASTTGLLGTNLSKATGLLVPRTEMYIAQSAKEITQGMNMFNTINAAGVKALAAGVQQNVLEGLAFEVMVQATMFKSPILEQQDAGDIVKNLAFGAALGGVIGGAFTGAVSRGKILKEVKREQGFLATAFNRELDPLTPGLPASTKVILLQNELDSMAQPLRRLGNESDDALNIRAAELTYEDKVRKIRLEQRAAINEMATSSEVIGNQMADVLYGTGTANTLETLLHTSKFGRLGDVLPVENAIKQAVKDQKAVDNLGLRYIKLTGEGSGQVTDTYPVIHNLADKVAGARSLPELKSAVIAAARSQGHKVDDGFSLLGRSAKSTESFHSKAEGRYIWASQLKQLPEDPFKIHFTDLPILQRALQDGRIQGIQLVDDAGNVLQDGFASVKGLQDYIIATKEDIASKLLERSFKKGTEVEGVTSEMIAKITDMRMGRLESTAVGENVRDYFATRTASEEYTALLKKKGLLSQGADVVDTRFLPSYAKVSYDVPASALDVDGHVNNAMTYFAEQAKLLQQQADNVVANHAGSLAELIPTITADDLRNVNTTGQSGAGVVSFANATTGSTGAIAQLLGSLTQELTKKMQKITADSFESALAPLSRNPAAAIEHATVNQKVTRSGKLWVRLEQDSPLLQGNNPAGLIERTLYNKLLKGGDEVAGTLYDDVADSVIPILRKETLDAIDAELALTAKRTTAFAEINSVRGASLNKDPLVYRPIRPNLQEYTHFAFVKDNRVTGSGHTTMLHASSPEKLEALINSVRTKSPEFQVITKQMSDDWFKARDEYQYARSLNENYINAEMANKGIFSEFYTKTDPQKIVNDILNQHLREDKVLATELMRLKNESAFNFLEDAGKRYSDVSGSTFSGSSLSRLEREGKNPYTDYIKTALNVSKVSEYPLIYNFNSSLDKAVSRVVGSVRDVFSKAKSPAELDSINSTLQEYGMNTAYANSAEVLLANHSAPKGELTKFVRRANAILSTFTLGMDPMNAITNAVGANVLRFTELHQLTDAIRAGNKDIAGKLSAVAKVAVPGTGGDSIFTPRKLVQNAIADFVREAKDGPTSTYFKELGILKGPIDQFRSILDDFTLQGTETVPDLQRRLDQAFEKARRLQELGQKYSGNQLSEEFNRYVSAHSMKQLTDLAESAGLMTKKEAGVYINTFVNRVEGNIVASQRPLIFQGPIGQAVGLFQSYQFNLMQQMFRYVSEGTKKDAAMLLGLQGTFFGLAGLPAFQFINQQVIANLGGNKERKDAFDMAVGVAGKESAEFFMYGIPSNILQANLYTRGEINPRQLTILPTQLSEVPIVGAYTKFFGSMKESVSKVAGGAPIWESMLQGLEHNGISRPLAGLAQVLQATGPEGLVYSTSNRGSILYSNDLFSWASAVRLAGARPLDEAVVNDSVYRVHSYQQQNRERMNKLAEIVKASVVAGNKPGEDAISEFAAKYAEAGGKQVNFNKWMMTQYKNANVPQSVQLATSLTNPFAQKVQLLME